MIVCKMVRNPFVKFNLIYKHATAGIAVTVLISLALVISRRCSSMSSSKISRGCLPNGRCILRSV